MVYYIRRRPRHHSFQTKDMLRAIGETGEVCRSQSFLVDLLPHVRLLNIKG